MLVTGATGTLGQAIVKELLSRNVPRIVIFSRDEYKQYEMQQTIPDPEKRLRYFIGDVRDLARLKRAFEGVKSVIHCAALKQVEAAEYNPFEAVKTNILGAQNVIEAALDSGIESVLGISTDKASDPTTLYGATKLCADRLFLAANAFGAGRTKFAVIRFGNIAFSRGSVIPKWKSLGPVVPVTDPQCTRYWITVEDAARHSLDCLGKTGSYFPAMPAFRLGDLAEALGKEMKVVGLSPGERLHENGSDLARRMTVEELKGLL